MASAGAGSLGVRPWESLTTVDIAQLDPASCVAVLPVAAIEQHGPHLPLGTDAVIADGLLDAALQRLADATTVLRLPTQRIGHSPEHAAFPGTLTLQAATVLALWTDIGRSVAAAGVRKLVLFNSHGGQGSLVDLAAQALRSDALLRVVRCSYYRISLPDGWVDPRERRYGLHGGQLETSLMLHLAPQLVRRAQCADFRSAAEDWEGAHPGLEVEGETGLAWQAEDLNPQGATGDAAAASAALGARLVDFYAGRIAAVIDAASRLDPVGGNEAGSNPSGG